MPVGFAGAFAPPTETWPSLEPRCIQTVTRTETYRVCHGSTGRCSLHRHDSHLRRGQTGDERYRGEVLHYDQV